MQARHRRLMWIGVMVAALAVWSLHGETHVAIGQEESNTDQVWLPVVVDGAMTSTFSFVIDDSLEASQPFLPEMGGGAARPAGVAVGADGVRDEYVTNELVVFAESETDLAPFLARYDGVVLRNGAPFVPEGEEPPDPARLVESNWYLVQVNPQRSALEDLAANMQQAGMFGQFAFSSEDAARLLAMALREEGAHLNLLMVGDGQYDEHPDDTPGDFLSAENWWWMTEDDDPTTAVEDGLSVGVTHAWAYLRYHGLPPTTGAWSPPRIAIVDSGFALDESSGEPLNGNLDFFPTRPWQADLAENDNRAGGQNLLTCAGTPCPWHGTGAFGVALARHSNQYGGAGTSGNAAWPMLLRVDPSSYTIADAIHSAAVNGADVVSLSLGMVCNSTCRSDTDVNDVLQDAVDFATGLRVVVLAAAGNNGMALDGRSRIPCELEKVICVGSVNQNGNNVFNFGGGVDIWAPTNVFSTVTPATAAGDNDDTGADEVQRFGGTSASTPFVAGIVGMMKALDPAIPWNRVQTILQETANSSSDANVATGYVDAHRALLAVRANEPPTLEIINPDDGAALSYKPGSFRATAVDPETDDPDSGVVKWSSNVDGLLCTVEGFYWAALSSYCSVGSLSLGEHIITIVATDAHGGEAEEVITVEAVNHPPSAVLTGPADDSTYYSHQTVTLSAYIFDQDGPWEIEWRSDLDGVLGDTWQVKRQLSTGTHQITVQVTDELGLMDDDSITLNIIPGAGVPTIEILEPTDPTHFPDTPIDFRARITDPEDGALSGASVRWFSNIDGLLGTGRSFTASLTGPATPCNPEYIRHVITVVAMDSDGNEIREQFQLSIGVLC